MNTYTDVIVNAENHPFITLTESKMPNTWYHEKIDTLFCLTSRGFRALPKSSKKQLIERDLLNNEKE